jgi:hypothetical protein
MGDQVPVVARQATLDELTSILEDTPAEVIEAAVALIQVAMQPQEIGTSKALLDELPLKVGLSSDSSEWSDQKLDQAFAYLESTCQALKGFEKTFKKHMAKQIGHYFGLAEPPRNWNDTLTVALEWRKNMVGQVHPSDLGGAPDSRDLLSVLDDDPHNFEQVFLNTLPHRWDLGLFEQWRTISVRDKYLARLQQAKDAVETRAAELGILSPEPPKPTSEESITPPSADRVEVPQPSVLLPDKPPVPTTGEEPQQPDDVGKPPIRPEPPVQPLPEKPPPSTVSSEEQVVAKALQQITQIIGQLPQKEQYILWEKLCEIYDPR